MQTDQKFKLCRIEGKVQGVGYRVWTQTTAARFGVRGWVKNETDGSVSACFAGTAQNVRTLIERCREGPPGATVTAVIEHDASAADAGDESRFNIR